MNISSKYLKERKYFNALTWKTKQDVDYIIHQPS
jgi:hypothetical protein